VYTTVHAYEYTPVTTLEAYYTESPTVESIPYGSVVNSIIAVVVTPPPYPTTAAPSMPGYSNSTVAAISSPSASYTTASPAEFTGGAGMIAANIAAFVGAVAAAVAML